MPGLTWSSTKGKDQLLLSDVFTHTRQPALAGVPENESSFNCLRACLETSTGQELSCMNKCEGAFSLQRSMLSTAEREVRFVSVQKDGLSQLLCAEHRAA